MKSLMIILLSAMLTDNFVLAKFMGICPFLGVSKKLDSASGMGLAVTFVMICATIVTISHSSRNSCAEWIGIF